MTRPARSNNSVFPVMKPGSRTSLKIPLDRTSPLGQKYYPTKHLKSQYCDDYFSYHSSRHKHVMSKHRNQSTVATEPTIFIQDRTAAAPISGPKTFMADDVQNVPAVPEAAMEQASQPALKAPRLEASGVSVDPLASSASELPRVIPPDALKGAEQPSILTQPVQPDAAENLDTSQIPKKDDQDSEPSCKIAKQRLKQRVSRRALGPLAGGSVRAKKLLSELDKAARELAPEIHPNTAAAHASEDDDLTQGMESQPTPATTLMDNLREPPETEEHKSKRPR